jgi:hypothetical protein
VRISNLTSGLVRLAERHDGCLDCMPLDRNDAVDLDVKPGQVTVAGSLLDRHGIAEVDVADPPQNVVTQADAEVGGSPSNPGQSRPVPTPGQPLLTTDCWTSSRMCRTSTSRGRSTVPATLTS